MPRRRRMAKGRRAFVLDSDASNAALFRHMWEWYWGAEADAAWVALRGQLGYADTDDWRTALPNVDDVPDPRVTVGRR